MKTSIAVATAMLLPAGAASAQFFRATADGTAQLIFQNPTIALYGHESTVTDQVGGFNFLTANGLFQQTFLPGSPDQFGGNLNLRGAGSNDLLVVSMQGDLFGTLPGGHATFGGTASITQAGGIYSGLSGTGEFAGWTTFNGASIGEFSVTVQIDAVPGPAGLVVLGAGGMLAMRRRR